MKFVAILIAAIGIGAVAPAFAQENASHTVLRGDTLFRIAQRYNVSVDAIIAANNIANPSRIFAGTVLVIPGTAPAASEPVVVAEAAPAAVTTQTVTHVVARGEALSSIARNYGVDMNTIIRDNNIRNANSIFTGQRLIINGANPAVIQAVAAAAPASAPITGQIAGTHTVRPGESLSQIARTYGVSWTQLASANGIADPNRIEAGMQLRIPTASAQAAPVAAAPGARVGSGREIVVVLSTQMIYAYEDGALVHSALSSTGLPATPTVQGDYRVYAKYQSQAMSGPGYYLPGVPWILYFYQGYAVHGTYWHSNFGTPMSRGCVNLPPEEARWFYEFASIGTPVHVRWA